MAAVLTIAVTLVAGAALYGYVNGQAANSENNIGVANARNVNFLNEQFVVAQIVYNAYPSTNSVTIYFYNSGEVTGNFVSIDVFSGHNAMNVLFTGTGVDYLIPSQSGCSVSITGGSSQYESSILGNDPNSFSVPIGGITSIKLTLPNCNAFPTGSTFSAGNTYGVTVVGQYGNLATAYQEM